jgi:probable phosphoglycerate mutase
MSTNILLIRHGETAWNAERRLQGHTDIALNGEGRRQADAVARALAGEAVAAVISSDLQRAFDTAQAIAAQRGLPVQTDSGLRERCYGAFEGMLYAEIAQRYPAEYAHWQARNIDALLPAGQRTAETYRQFYARAVESIVRLAQDYPGQTIVIVAHGGVLECAYRAARGMALDSPRDFEIKNAGINRFVCADGKLSLAAWGEVAHLAASAIDELS